MGDKNKNCRKTLASAFKYMASNSNLMEMRSVLEDFMPLLTDEDLMVRE